MHFIKIKRGAEYFWCRVLKRNEDGSKLVRCENDTFDAASPKFRDELTISASEEIYDVMNVNQRDIFKVA